MSALRIVARDSETTIIRKKEIAGTFISYSPIHTKRLYFVDLMRFKRALVRASKKPGKIKGAGTVVEAADRVESAFSWTVSPTSHINPLEKSVVGKGTIHWKAENRRGKRANCQGNHLVRYRGERVIVAL